MAMVQCNGTVRPQADKTMLGDNLILIIATNSMFAHTLAKLFVESGGQQLHTSSSLIFAKLCIYTSFSNTSAINASWKKHDKTMPFIVSRQKGNQTVNA